MNDTEARAETFRLRYRADPEARRERHLRYLADREGFVLRKSRSRTPEAAEYGRYWLIDADVNEMVCGGFPYNGTDLDEIEEFLTEV